MTTKSRDICSVISDAASVASDELGITDASAKATEEVPACAATETAMSSSGARRNAQVPGFLGGRW